MTNEATIMVEGDRLRCGGTWVVSMLARTNTTNVERELAEVFKCTYGE